LNATSLHDTAVLLEREQLLVIRLRLWLHNARTAEWEAMMSAFVSARVRYHRCLRRVGNIDHHSPLVQLRDRLLAQGRQPVPLPLSILLPRIGVAQMGVPVVREREVAGAEVGKAPDVGEILANRVTVFHTNQDRPFPVSGDSPHIVGGQGKRHAVWCNLLRQSMDGLELFHRLLLRPRKVFGSE
jgi:hypothetical protein